MREIINIQIGQCGNAAGTQNSPEFIFCNFKNNTLLGLPGKVFAKVLEARCRLLVEDKLGGSQWGFRPRRSTTDQLLTLRLILEGSWEYARPVFACFIDLGKAYDRVPRGKFWDVLETYGIGGSQLSAIGSLYESCRSCVRINGVIAGALRGTEDWTEPPGEAHCLPVCRKFWEVVSADHGLDRTGSFNGEPNIRLERINVFFNEVKGLLYTPRSVMIDLEKTSLEAVRASHIGQMFDPKNFLFGSRGAGNNWAKGHFSEGKQLCDISLDVIRKEVECCDCFYGFQIVHSVTGGTGGGLGSRLITKLKDEYPHNMLSNYSIIPNIEVATSVVEPYNTILTINHLIEFSDMTFCIDNGALFFIASNTLKINQAGYCDLNYLIALAMSGTTASMRFPGPFSSSLRGIAANMIPFPRMHFFVPSCAPLLSRGSKAYRKFTVSEITGQLFDRRNLFANCDSKEGKFMTAACLFRGELFLKEVEQQISLIQNRASSEFVEWIPDNIKIGVCNTPLPGLNKTATLIGNTTAIKSSFTTVREQYLTMFNRRAFLHWYTGEGLDLREFNEAENNLMELLEEFKEREDAHINEVSNKKSEKHIWAKVIW